MLINKGRYDSKDAFTACAHNEGFNRLSQVLTDLDVERLAALYGMLEEFGDGGN